MLPSTPSELGMENLSYEFLQNPHIEHVLGQNVDTDKFAMPLTPEIEHLLNTRFGWISCTLWTHWQVLRFPPKVELGILNLNVGGESRHKEGITLRWGRGRIGG